MNGSSKNSLCVPQEAMLPYRSWLFSLRPYYGGTQDLGEGNWIICPLRWQVLPHRKGLASWLKTFLAKIDEDPGKKQRKVRTGTAGSKIYKKSLSGKPEAGNCGGRTGSQPQLSFYDHKERNGDHIPAAYDPGKVKYSKKTF